MTSMTIFAWLFGVIGAPVTSSVNGIIEALSGYATPILKYAIIAYVAGRMIVIAYSPEAEPLGTFLKTLMKCAIAYWVVANASVYNEYLGTLFLSTIPKEISGVIAGAAGTPVVGGGAFDALWNKAYAAGLAVMKDLPWGFKTIAIGAGIVGYWIIAIGCIALGFVVYLASLVLLALLIAIGILFAALFPFAGTRGYFDRWVSACLSMILLQLFVVTLLSMVIQAVNTALAAIATGVGGDPLDEFKMLLGASVLFIVSAAIAKQLPALAVACAGGVYADVASLGTAVYGSVGVVGAAAGRGAGAAVAAGGSGARGGVGYFRMAGKSLSGVP